MRWLHRQLLDQVLISYTATAQSSYELASSRGPSLSLDHQRFVKKLKFFESICFSRPAGHGKRITVLASTVLLRYFFGDCVCVGMREYHLRGNHMVGLLNSLDRRPELQ